MKEKILHHTRYGLAALTGIVLLYIVMVGIMVISILGSGRFGSFLSGLGLIGSIFVMSFAWILFFGIKEVKPQEAIVLTLFGTYIGTIRKEGLHFVNPFCKSLNPAADTKLSQSGDVKVSDKGMSFASFHPAGNNMMMYKTAFPNRKISLKAMTLNNSRQKINDCLGNPVEIGIAVIWRVRDTAMAVFNVDNYMEFLSLQCDSTVRNIVHLDEERKAAMVSNLLVVLCGNQDTHPVINAGSLH